MGRVPIANHGSDSLKRSFQRWPILSGINSTIERRPIGFGKDRREKRPGWPHIRQEIVDLVLQMAKKDPAWGFRRIQGALNDVGFHVCESTVANILKAKGIEPAPDRKRTGSWKTFLKAHCDVLATADFTTVKVWTKGVVMFYLLFVMELKSRRVELAGITTSPNELWMKQVGMNLTDCEGFLLGKQYLLLDRDTEFCAAFQRVLRRKGIEPNLLPLEAQPECPHSSGSYDA